MNERQAESQYKLSNKRSLGRNSLINNREEDDFDEEDDEGGNEDVVFGVKNESEKRVTVKVFLLSIVLGIVLDIISIIPFIGWFIGTVSLLLLYWKLGVKFHFKNIMKFGSCDLIEFIPAISIIPAFTLAIILNVGPMVWGGGQDQEDAPEPSHAVQKTMSMIKK